MVDVILGDSAKTRVVDPVSGKVRQVDAGYYDAESFLERLCLQLGLPYSPGTTDTTGVQKHIRARLEGRRAVIVLDNLENIAAAPKLLDSLRALVCRDTRILVTTRDIGGLDEHRSDQLVVHLCPLQEMPDVQSFLKWHIRRHSNEHPELAELEHDIGNDRLIKTLVRRTGGVPLLIQLVLSDVARYSWDYLDRLPRVFDKELLDFLYSRRWQELDGLGERGRWARRLLYWLAEEQYRGKRITHRRLISWASENSLEAPALQESLRLLHEMFLIVNYDLEKGNYALFPSLVEYLSLV